MKPKLKYRLLKKYKWVRKLHFKYLITFHKQRTLSNFRKLLIEAMKDEYSDKEVKE